MTLEYENIYKKTPSLYWGGALTGNAVALTPSRRGGVVVNGLEASDRRTAPVSPSLLSYPLNLLASNLSFLFSRNKYPAYGLPVHIPRDDLPLVLLRFLQCFIGTLKGTDKILTFPFAA